MTHRTDGRVSIDTKGFDSIITVVDQKTWQVEDLRDALAAMEAGECSPEAISVIKTILDELGEFADGTIIREDYFEEWCEDEAGNMGWLGTGEASSYIVIDWEATASNMKSVHGDIVIDDTIFYFNF